MFAYMEGCLKKALGDSGVLVGKMGGQIGVSIVWDFCKRQEM